MIVDFNQFFKSPDIFQKRCEDLTAYNQTLLVEKSELTKMMADRERQMEGSSNEARIRELEKANTQLQQTLNDQIAFHSEAMEKREKDVSMCACVCLNMV